MSAYSGRIPNPTMYTPVATITPANLCAPNEPKEYTVKNSSERYTRTYLQYNFGTPDQPKYGEPLFELQVCKGRVRRNNNGDPKLNLTITDEKDIAGLQQLHKAIALCIDKHKAKYSMKNFTPSQLDRVRAPLFYPQDKDGEPIVGAAPIVTLKINEKSKFKTLRPKLTPHGSPKYGPDGSVEVVEKVVDYETLLNKQLQCSVVFNVRDIFYTRGHDPIPTLLVRSCIVLKVEDSGDIAHTKSTIVASFLKENPDALSALLESEDATATEHADPDLLPSANNVDAYLGGDKDVIVTRV